ncbi:c-type cytochrome [Halomonas huangheensis]|uniref:Cytochrome c domain-containing protein n=1 Tax=Halomonas huangheensis TaxID=1178482 RepID=W1N6P8_9GAMM|nr:c-type cytochrome [Halomonas huangheensis]ALM51013.1 cytochrome C [Halomonas huangheensis]ERL51242.1 hypothetical protein BJB45_15175 [Halomonas huangheensis]
MRQLLASLAITLGAVGTVHADMQSDADAAAGKEKAQACAACHGPTGVGIGPIFPNLAGQHAPYLARQIIDIRDGDRAVPQMVGQLDDYTDQDAWNVAAWFASQEPVVGQADPDQQLLERGKELYRAGDLAKGVPACSACHSPNGGGIGSAGYPALSGQHAEYIVTSLQAFAAGDRSNDLNGMMSDIASRMSDEDMEAVGNYVQGLH